MGQPESIKLVERLVDLGVLDKEINDDQLIYSDEFIDRKKDILNRNKNYNTIDKLEDVKKSGLKQDILTDAAAIREFDNEINVSVALDIAYALSRGENPPPKTGVPEGFVPLHGFEIQRFLEQYPNSVLYFWRQECESCKVVKNDLETILSKCSFSSKVGFGAVNGEECAKLIYKKYEVKVAPTILFVVDGNINSRLVGVHYPEVLEKEIQYVQ